VLDLSGDPERLEAIIRASWQYRGPHGPQTGAVTVAGTRANGHRFYGWVPRAAVDAVPASSGTPTAAPRPPQAPRQAAMIEDEAKGLIRAFLAHEGADASPASPFATLPAPMREAVAAAIARTPAPATPAAAEAHVAAIAANLARPAPAHLRAPAVPAPRTAPHHRRRHPDRTSIACSP
jgi:hypothetical protein